MNDEIAAGNRGACPSPSGLSGLAGGAVSVAYRTPLGVMLQGRAEQALLATEVLSMKGKIQLIFTSPPFPLNRKKRYGNLQGNAYSDWLAGFAPAFGELLAPRGSIVIEMGNAWEPGEPVMSTLALESLLRFRYAGKFHLCEQFICYNKARLPSPAQWVNVERIRVKDSFTHVWWMSATPRPRADNRKILRDYSPAMLKLLETQRYNPGKRPSEHHIGKTSFLKNNSGAIPSNVLEFTNTSSSDDYLKFCKHQGIEQHPARMPIGLPEFFIRFLTTGQGVVLDPFAGSNTTGAAAEALGRRWISIEPDAKYIDGSVGRFASISKEDGT
jgi:site-specific DNA-methyltransferase (cytosine-N4-specific)